MLLQVHDELVLEVPKDELARTARLVQEVMAEAYPLDIPLSTEARSGPSWGEMTVLSPRAGAHDRTVSSLLVQPASVLSTSPYLGYY